MDGILLSTAEGQEESRFAGTGGEAWEWLEAEKEEVRRELLTDGLLHEEADGSHESEPADESRREVEWWHRGQLEARLRDINRAQDRLIDGGYGRCNGCGMEIGRRTG